VTFESGSKLSRIESFAFWHCPSLSSICIPSSVEVLCGNCFFQCGEGLRVTFESGSKLSSVERSHWGA
jgi:hypothetical protein